MEYDPAQIDPDLLLVLLTARVIDILHNIFPLNKDAWRLFLEEDFPNVF